MWGYGHFYLLPMLLEVLQCAVKLIELAHLWPLIVAGREASKY